jgi:outer membrane protein
MLFLLLTAICTPAVAQQSVRIGYVDMKAVLDNAPQVIAGRKKLDREFRPRNDALEAEEARVETLEQRLLDGDLPAEDQARLERRVRELRRGLNREREDLRDELSFRRTEEVQRLEDQINVAVQEIARQYGYDLVLSSPVIYANDTLDITDLILEQLQAEFEADAREAELP